MFKFCRGDLESIFFAAIRACQSLNKRLLLIDDLDKSILRNGDQSSHDSNFLSALQTGFDYIIPKYNRAYPDHSIVVVATCTDISLIPSSLLVPSRFGYVVHLTPPTYENRLLLFQNLLSSDNFEVHATSSELLEYDMDDDFPVDMSCKDKYSEALLRISKILAVQSRYCSVHSITTAVSLAYFDAVLTHISCSNSSSSDCDQHTNNNIKRYNKADGSEADKLPPFTMTKSSSKPVIHLNDFVEKIRTLSVQNGTEATDGPTTDMAALVTRTRAEGVYSELDLVNMERHQERLLRCVLHPLLSNGYSRLTQRPTCSGACTTPSILMCNNFTTVTITSVLVYLVFVSLLMRTTVFCILCTV